MNAMRKNRKKCYLGNWRLLLSWINCMGPPKSSLREGFIACCIVQKTARANWAL